MCQVRGKGDNGGMLERDGGSKAAHVEYDTVDPIKFDTLSRFGSGIMVNRSSHDESDKITQTLPVENVEYHRNIPVELPSYGIYGKVEVEKFASTFEESKKDSEQVELSKNKIERVLYTDNEELNETADIQKLLLADFSDDEEQDDLNNMETSRNEEQSEIVTNLDIQNQLLLDQDPSDDDDLNNKETNRNEEQSEIETEDDDDLNNLETNEKQSEMDIQNQLLLDQDLSDDDDDDSRDDFEDEDVDDTFYDEENAPVQNDINLDDQDDAALIQMNLLQDQDISDDEDD